jgi:hypothetical protein
MNSRWRTASKPRRCTVFPTVWAAIVGCTGSGRDWRYYIAGSFGRRPEFACPTCREAKDRFDALIGPAHQQALLEAQAAAGVEDYRTARAKVIDGVPRLLGAKVAS